MNQPVINLMEVQRVRSRGGSRFELRVPELRVEAGLFAAIVGESGCGKSTMLDILGLVMRPDAATDFQLHPPGQPEAVDIMQQDETHLAALRRRHLGYVLQTGGLLPFLSVWDNIRLPCRINGETGREDDLRELCKHLRIEGQLNKKPAHLSGGQRQRAAIARALAHRPSIVLADEPTAAVDKLTARDIRDTFVELSRDLGVTVLMVTHDTDLLSGIADRSYTFKVERISSTETVSTCIPEEDLS